MTFYYFCQKRSVFGHKIWILIINHFYGFLWLSTNPATIPVVHLISDISDHNVKISQFNELKIQVIF